MYVEGIGEVELIGRKSGNDRFKRVGRVGREGGREGRGERESKGSREERGGINTEKLNIVKLRERLDLVIRQEVGISYGQMMIEASRLNGREIRDLVEMSLVECTGLGGYMVRNRVTLRKRYPSGVVRVSRNREDEVLHERAKYVNRSRW